MSTVTIIIPAKDVPPLLKAAKELEMDMIAGEMDSEGVHCHFIIHDLYQLILLGTIRGINQGLQSMEEPLKE